MAVSPGGFGFCRAGNALSTTSCGRRARGCALEGRVRAPAHCDAGHGGARAATRQRGAGPRGAVWGAVVRTGAAPHTLRHARRRGAWTRGRHGGARLLRAPGSVGPLARRPGARGRIPGKGGRREHRLRTEIGGRGGAGLAREPRPLPEHHGSAIRADGDRARSGPRCTPGPVLGAAARRAPRLRCSWPLWRAQRGAEIAVELPDEVDRDTRVHAPLAVEELRLV